MTRVYLMADFGKGPVCGPWRWAFKAWAEQDMVHAYRWAEQVEEIGADFGTCLAPGILALISAADFRIRDGWAV